MSAAESSIAASRALDDLYRNHASEVYRYAYAVLGNHADAEDVTQTTFVNALRALERGERPRKPSNWLITITHNIVRQRYRQQQARPTEVVLDRDVAQQQADDAGPSMEDLVRALQRIPTSQREALVMRELEGRSYGEIAQILDLSTGALETLLFRARRSLADELENLVTCDRAELSFSKQLDGRLSRKERKRLLDHIAECPSCARLQTMEGKQRRAFKGLALLPLPLSLTLFKGTPSATAAIGLPTIGATGTVAVVGGSTATGGGGLLGGLALGGVAVKAAAVVTAVSVASGVGYVGTKEVRSHLAPSTKTPVANVKPGSAQPKQRPSSVGGAGRSAGTTSNGKALATGSERASSPTGSSRGDTAPGQTGTAPGLAKDEPAGKAANAPGERGTSSDRPTKAPTESRRPPTAGKPTEPRATATPTRAKGSPTKVKPTSAQSTAKPAAQPKVATAPNTPTPATSPRKQATTEPEATATSEPAVVEPAPETGGNGNGSTSGNAGGNGNNK